MKKKEEEMERKIAAKKKREEMAKLGIIEEPPKPVPKEVEPTKPEPAKPEPAKPESAKPEAPKEPLKPAAKPTTKEDVKPAAKPVAKSDAKPATKPVPKGGEAKPAAAKPVEEPTIPSEDEDLDDLPQPVVAKRVVVDKEPMIDSELASPISVRRVEELEDIVTTKRDSVDNEPEIIVVAKAKPIELNFDDDDEEIAALERELAEIERQEEEMRLKKEEAKRVEEEKKKTETERPPSDRGGKIVTISEKGKEGCWRVKISSSTLDALHSVIIKKIGNGRKIQSVKELPDTNINDDDDVDLLPPEAKLEITFL